MPPNMPTFQDWLRSAADADKGLALLLFIVGIAFAWLIICRFWYPQFEVPLARVLAFVWFGTGLVVLIAQLLVFVR